MQHCKYMHDLEFDIITNFHIPSRISERKKLGRQQDAPCITLKRRDIGPKCCESPPPT